MQKSIAKHVPVCVRWHIRRDLPEVLDIEQRSFEHAWVEEDFLFRLRQRNAIGMVSEHQEKIRGYMVYELNKSEIHVLNFCVDPDWRHCGIGQQMIEKLVAKLSQQRRQRIMLEVRETNLDAQLFFQTMGFYATKVVRDFYEDSDEDAFRFVYEVERNCEISR